MCVCQLGAGRCRHGPWRPPRLVRFEAGYEPVQICSIHLAEAELGGRQRSSCLAQLQDLFADHVQGGCLQGRADAWNMAASRAGLQLMPGTWLPGQDRRCNDFALQGQPNLQSWQLGEPQCKA
eukprot:366050-Chlamydomonas_euryale.AAC.19